MPVHTYRWKDIAMSNDKDALEKLIPPGSELYRIEDCGEAIDERHH
jgi:hypothetical protein